MSRHPKSLITSLGFLLGAALLPTLCQAARIISGTVTFRDDGTPVESARVVARDADSLSEDEIMGSGITNDEGKYRIEYPKKHWDPDPLNQGKWRPDIFVTVDLQVNGKWTRVNRSPSSGDYKDHEVRNDRVINPTIDRPARVYGVIRDENRRPVANASVKALDADPSTEDSMGKGLSNTNGNYEITYARKAWDPGPHNSGLWRPDIYLKAESSDGMKVGRSPIFSNHRVSQDLMVDVTIKPRPPKDDRQSETTCDRKPKGPDSQFWNVVVIDPASRCNLVATYLANSDSDAQQCANSAGFAVANELCEHVVIVYSSDRSWCSSITIHSSSTSDAEMCARYTTYASGLAKDITNQVTSGCNRGIDWGRVNEIQTQLCGH